MANGAYLLSPKLSDAATLSGSAAVGGAGIVNLQAARPKLAWRSTTATPYVVGNFGASKAVNALMLGFINGKSGDKFRLRMASTETKLTDGSAEYDSRVGVDDQPVWPVGANLAAYLRVHRPFTFATQTLQWFRLDFDFSGNSDGYVEMGRLMLGARIEPVTSVKAGWTVGLEEAVAETLDLGGEEAPRPMGVKRVLKVVWHDLTQAEMDLLYALMLERGSAKDVSLVVEPDNAAYPMHQIAVGRIKDALSFAHTFKAAVSASSQHFTVEIGVREMAPIEMA